MFLAERLWRTLLSAPAQRVAEEESLRAMSLAAREPESRKHAEAKRNIEARRAAAIAQILETSKQARDQADARLAKQLARIEASEKAARQAADLERLELIEQLQTRTEERTWTADTMYESLEPRPAAEFEELRQSSQAALAAVVEQVDEVIALLHRAHLSLRGAAESDGRDPAKDDLAAQAALASQIAIDLRSRTGLRLLRLPMVHVLLTLALGGVGGAAAGLVDNWARPSVVTGTAVGVGVSLLATLVAWTWSGRKLRSITSPLMGAKEAAKATTALILQIGQRRREEMANSFRQQHQRERDAALKSVAPARKELESLYTSQLRTIEEGAANLRRNSLAQQRTTVESADQACNDAHTSTHEQHDRLLEAEVARHTARLSEIALVESNRLTALRKDWHDAQMLILHDEQALIAIEHEHFRPWRDGYWSSFRGRTSPSGAAKIGSVTLNLRDIPGALPADSALAWPAGASRVVHVPIALTLPSAASLIVETAHEGRAQGIAILQEAMMRILVALPPGTARFTVADPIGLGEGFAAFMHLADEAEHLIGERIWTDPRHIEQKLSDLCEHMETVIQKFLRNEFETLDDYNRQAGEIAEPYRFLVLCDFPANISDSAAQKLASIINSGARCGVFTLILRDTRLALPATLTLDELHARAVRLFWRDGAFRYAGEPFEQFAIHPSPPAGRDETIALLQRISVTARDSKRVEVPFSAIAPPANEIWTESAAQLLRVPLGRSGATRLQSIVLGTGTSQHALIAGKTGSGKSTLLHALITNIALRFSPDEVELWLIDFKKGVEFRTYATNKLPHARAVAVESDREFGLSVLRGLDTEMRRRGEVFRELGVQDLPGYRKSGAKEVIPRTLLIVDEFQELFTEDDKVSEESALLLDRLVRQGRAFGMHVVLGSQTLGGAYSIARATMGQMAVRIALQCNEADSQMILSDDNLAGRLLSRPGDAIYNDSGGLVEGNNPFQVVWLPDEERDQLLARIRRKQAETPPQAKPRMIVFEGNAPADLEANRLLESALVARHGETRKSPALLWFGDAISIKDPTAVALRRQSGTNLMVIGQREDAALGLCASAMVSLASQFQTGSCSLYLLDGTAPDDASYGMLAGLMERLSIKGRAGGLRDAEELLTEVVDEMTRRQTEHSMMAPTWLVMVHGLHRFRSLRRNEDDYSFSSSSEGPVSPDKVLAALLRDGPALGIHVMVTCDSATNLARSCDRNAIREFEWRMLFQVSASDSSTLIDSPVASRLGPQRVLLHSEESGSQEKFRPYAWPQSSWLDRKFPR